MIKSRKFFPRTINDTILSKAEDVAQRNNGVLYYVSPDFSNVAQSFINVTAADVKSPSDLYLFSRASTGSYFGSDRIMRYAGVNEPRINYNPSTGVRTGLLVESQSTNTIPYSQDFSLWTQTPNILTHIPVPGPDGNPSSARRVERIATSATILAAVLAATATTLTYSIHIKLDSNLATIPLLVRNATTLTNFDGATFNLATGAITGIGWTSTHIGDGWYRVSYTRSTGISIGDNLLCYCGANGNTGTIGTYFVIFGGQLEPSATVTSYIPTSGAAVTRAADIVTYSTQGATPVTAIGQSVGWLKDMGAGGKNATQPTSGNQPTLVQMENGPFALKFDGIDDWMDTNCSAGGTPYFTLIIAGNSNTDNTVAAGCLNAAADTRSYIGRNNTGFIGGAANGVTFDTLASSTTKWTNTHVATVVRNNTDLKLYVDKYLASSQTCTTVGSNLNAYLGALDNNGTAANFWKGPIVAMFGCPSVLSDADRAVIEEFFSYLCSPSTWYAPTLYDGETPTLTLDFSNKKYQMAQIDYSFNQLITMTRATTATYIGNDGLIKTAAVNEPRFEYDPVTLNPKGILIEDSRTNYFPYSSDFNATGWNRARLTATPAATISPDGGMNATKIYNNGTAGTAYLGNFYTYSSNTVYTHSFFVKKAELDTCSIQYLTGAGWSTDAVITFNLTKGIASATGTPGPYGMRRLSNGWWRIYTTNTYGAVSQNVQYPNLAIDNPLDGVSGIYVWGAQAEWTFPTSYIPTNGAAVSRAIDSCTMDATLFSANGYGTLFSEGDVPFVGGNSYPGFVGMKHNTNNDFVHLLMYDLLANDPKYAELYTGGVAQYSGSAGNYTVGATTKMAIAYETNNAILSSDGVNGSGDVSVTVGAFEKLMIGSSKNSPPNLNGHVKQIRYYQKRISNSEMIKLTT